ncbi:MAG: Uma2 family endonuclease [Tunicatimonas sp.]
MQSTLESKPTSEKISRALIYEEMDGEPIYYRGYQDVLNKKKTLDDIIGSSSLQAVIIKVLLKYLYTNVDDKQHEVFTNETGLYLARGNNLASDIAIYDTTALKNFKYDDHYFKIPPTVAVEIDTKADLSVMKWETYLKKKTEKLHAFGFKKIIWILSATQQLIIAEPDQDWITRDWHKPVEILPNHTINLGEMLRASGVE